MPETERSPMFAKLLSHAREGQKRGQPVPESVYAALDAFGIQDKADRERLSRELIHEFAEHGGEQSARIRAEQKPARTSPFSGDKLKAMIRDARFHELRYGPPEEKDE